MAASSRSQNADQTQPEYRIDIDATASRIAVPGARLVPSLVHITVRRRTGRNEKTMRYRFKGERGRLRWRTKGIVVSILKEEKKSKCRAVNTSRILGVRE